MRGVELDQLEEVVHEGVEGADGAAHLARVEAHRRYVLDDAVVDRLDHRPQAGQRRAQIVGDRRDQVTLLGLDGLLHGLRRGPSQRERRPRPGAEGIDEQHCDQQRVVAVDEHQPRKHGEVRESRHGAGKRDPEQAPAKRRAGEQQIGDRDRDRGDEHADPEERREVRELGARHPARRPGGERREGPEGSARGGQERDPPARGGSGRCRVSRAHGSKR